MLAGMSVLTTGLAPAIAALPSTPQGLPARALSPAAIREDLALLRRALELIHPGLYRHTPKPEMDRRFRELGVALPGAGTDLEVYRQISAFLAGIRCNHTKAEQPEAVEAWRTVNPGHLPFRFRLLEGRMIVLSSDPAQPALARGSEVLRINGRSIPELVATLGAYVPIDGDTVWARATGLADDGDLMGSDFDHFYPYVYGLRERFELDVRGPEGRGVRRTVLRPMTFREWRKLPNQGTGYRANFSDTTTWRLVDPEVALLTIPTFVNYRKPVNPTAFYGDIFRAINASGARRLIVDLRENGGGSSDATYTLADFLLDKPYVWNRAIRLKATRYGDLPKYISSWGDTDALFNSPLDRFLAQPDGSSDWQPPEEPDELLPRRPSDDRFQGPVTILTSPFNGSGSTMLIAKLRDEGQVRLVGGRSGGRGDGPTAGRLFNLNLPNSGFAVRIPNALNAMQVERFEPRGGVTPDILIEPTIADLRQGRDGVLETALADRGTPVPNRTSRPSDLPQRLVGDWAGVLEYRDFASDRRVTLQTGLTAHPDATGGVRLDYVFDDGPGKMVRSATRLSVDLKQQILTMADETSTDLYRFTEMPAARGGGPVAMVLWARGQENGAPVAVRSTLTVNPDAFTLLRETRSKGGRYLFRHEYRMVRASA